jgi:Sec-independent protein translocase protein TatA
MAGLILLVLIVIVVVIFLPIIALAKASQALRIIEELKERLRMLEARPQAARESAPAESTKIATQPEPPGPIIRTGLCSTTPASYDHSGAAKGGTAPVG